MIYPEDAPRHGQVSRGLEKELIRNESQITLSTLYVKLLQGLMVLIELATHLPFSKRISLILDRMQLAIEEAHHG